MAVIISSPSETPEQITESMAALGLKVEVEVQGTAPGEPAKVIETKSETTKKEPAEKVAEETKAADETVSDSETDKEEKKDEVKTEAKETPTDAEKVASEESDAPKSKTDRKLLKRIDTVTAQKNQLKESLEEKESRIAELEAKLAGRSTEEAEKEPEAVKPVRPKMPVASDEAIGFDEEKLTAAREKYEHDLDDYEDKKSAYIQAETAKELTAKQQAAEQAKEAKAVLDAHSGRVEEAKGRYEDWDEVAETLSDQGFNLVPVVYNGLLESPHSADILYHLATNLEEAETIASMRPDRALREIGKLEAKFSDGGRKKPRDKAADEDTGKKTTAKAEDKKPPATETQDTSSETKTTTQAKKPMETLTGGNKSNAVSALDIAEKGGSVLEFMRMRATEREAKGLRP